VRLQQVIWNLISNAVKFTPTGGWVSVEVGPLPPGHVQLVVADTGPGIPDAFLPHVFEPFRQADSTATRTHGGLGLGLAIARHLVEAHGGRIRAELGADGTGARFLVELPAAGQPEAGRAERPIGDAEAARAAATLTAVRVLVVEDNPDTRDLVRTVLEDR